LFSARAAAVRGVGKLCCSVVSTKGSMVMVSMFGLFCVFTDTGDCWNSKSYTLIVLKLRFQKNPELIPQVREAKQARPLSTS